MPRIDHGYVDAHNPIFNNKIENTVKSGEMTEKVIQMNTTYKMIDKSMFERSYVSHFDGIFRYCMTMVKDHVEAEDIIQSAFTDLWNDRQKLEIHTSIQAYLYKSVYFKCMNRIKREKVNQRYISTLPTQSTTVHESNPAILSEVNEMIHEAIDGLPDQCRKIFLLSRHEGMRYQEIADHLQLSIKTIENQMGKALKILRVHLSDYLSIFIFNLITFF